MTTINISIVAGISSTNENSDNLNLHPVLRRHYSSIGIGDVFVQQSPADNGMDDGRNGQWLFPSTYFAPSWKYVSSRSVFSGQRPANILGDELIGNIKCMPEDFVVREIALVQGQRQVADLELSSKSKLSISRTESDVDDTSFQKNQIQQEITTSRKSPIRCVDSAVSHVRLCNFSNQHSDLDQTSFLDEFKSILTRKFYNTDLHAYENPMDALLALQRLESDALELIHSLDETYILSETSSPPLLSSCELRLFFLVSSEQQKQDKTRIHQCFRNAFPLLVAESSPVVVDSIERENIYIIDVKIDTTFYELIPYLYAPIEDLPSLYSYAKYGFEYARYQSRRKSNNVPKTNTKNILSRGSSRYNYGCPLLRLKPNLPRSDRRPIHQIIDAKSKSMLGTETINGFPLETVKSDGSDTDDSASGTKTIETTTAIRISWTKMAARRSSKKRVREETTGSLSEIGSKFVLCVLRKCQREHLGMINTISAVLKCPPSSIGFAGIKDLQSVSYQFCTLNRFAAQRIRTTHDILSQRGIEIAPICEINHTLHKGDLIGNHFEIFLRNTRRVQLKFSACTNNCQASAPSFVEAFVPVDDQHLRSMVDRIRANGFVNFYGEQRVGDPGHRSMSGVRAFDIGKAMLHQNFTEAIDLLMTGRRVIKGFELEGDDIELFRRIWKDTNGDPIATMKALPFGGNSVPRERAVLKGLIRYGTEQPLAAFRCLPRNERLFFINAVRIGAEMKIYVESFPNSQFSYSIDTL
jgi:tRNA(Glu) U13 pseudouridine synthase TruD